MIQAVLHSAASAFLLLMSMLATAAGVLVLVGFLSVGLTGFISLRLSRASGEPASVSLSLGRGIQSGMARSESTGATSPGRQIYPIQVLRQHVTALEAAMTVTLASPKKEAVHRIRTSTRRIEAQLALLSLLPGLPDHARAAEKVLRALGKLRREAGKVRDLDVQRLLLEETPEKKGAAVDLAASDRLQRRAKLLRRTLKERREERAERLQQAIRRRSRSISRRLEKLVMRIEPAEQTAISSAELAALTRDWFRTNIPNADDITSADGLHSVRKAAKLARYIAESAVSSAGDQTKRKARSQSASELSEQFASLQQSGGDWHDLLTLAEIARHELGKRDPLTEELHRRCEAALAAYQEQLGHAPA